MKDGKYEGKDFINLPLPMPGEYDSLDLMAMRANSFLPQLKAQWLEELLRDAPVVYQRSSVPYVKHEFETGVWTEHRRAADTHTARLVAIKEIRK